jgi:hypothetical protein
MVGNVNVVFGGWYQRTTLHLSEVHRFLLKGTSDLDLSEVKLKALRSGLGLDSVRRVVGYLEYLEIKTRSGIKVKYFEDGLYVLSKEGSDIPKLKRDVKKYFDERFQPTINYLFSLGAPTPKILSNMKETHPFVIERVVSDIRKSKVDKKFGEVYLETVSNNIKVSKTRENIFVDVSKGRAREIEMLTEMQVFFSDFKLQLHKYLDIHRKIWEEIDEIGEKKFILGKDIGEAKSRLDSYQKTIQLIRNRINQMSNYAKTRRSISAAVNADKRLIDLFQYRFEDLFNTLEYIKEVWVMTLDYVNSGIRVLEGASSDMKSKGLDSIQFLVGVSVVSGIIGYLGPASLPEVTLSGALYVLGFGITAVILNKAIAWNNNRKKYGVSFVERSKRI